MSVTSSPGGPGRREAAIELEAVSQHFGDKTVLRDVSLRVESGEVAVVIGGSGAGKTTLLRIIIGLLRPSSGRVVVDGQDLATLGPRELRRARVRCGMVFQYSALLDSMTVLDNVALPLREHTRLTSSEIRERVEQMLAELDLSGASGLFPSELSGGMKKRVGLARALIRRPSLVMYDEPTSGLDPLTARLVADLIVSTRDRFGVTSVVISHDMLQAVDIADRLIVLERGGVVGDGPPGEVLSDHAGLAARFLAASQPRREVG